MSLKNQIIAWQIKRRAKTIDRKVVAANLEKVKTAGIIWKIDDREVHRLLVDSLKSKGVRITSLCFSDQPGSLQGETVVSSDDFTVSGKLRNSEIESFIEEKFDLLIDISLAQGIEVQYVLALSKATFKVGWSPLSLKHFDLVIDVSKRKEPGYLADQIVHYLGELNKAESEQKKSKN